MVKLKDRTAYSVTRVLKKLNLHKQLFKTITFDNGSGFAYCTDFETENLKIYYAHPYSAYERRINEITTILFEDFYLKEQVLKK